MNILLFRAKIDLCNHANGSTLYKAGKPLYKKKGKTSQNETESS